MRVQCTQCIDSAPRGLFRFRSAVASSRFVLKGHKRHRFATGVISHKRSGRPAGEIVAFARCTLDDDDDDDDDDLVVLGERVVKHIRPVGIVHVMFDVCCNGRAPGVQSLMIQVAKKASVLKRRKSRNRMDGQQQQQQQSALPPVTISGGISAGAGTGQNDNQRLENEGDVVFYMEEPKAGTPNRARRDNRWVIEFL